MTTPSLRRLRARSIWERGRADLLDVADAAARRWIPDESSRARVERLLDTRRREPPHRLAPLLEVFAKRNPEARVIEIGANENPRANPLVDLIRWHQWRTIVVEPIPEVFERLRTAYGHLPRVTLEPAAIAEADGEQPFYHVADQLDSESTGASATGSLQREILFAGPNYRPGLDELVRETVTRCLTFSSLCRIHGVGALDVLRIDTEGDEAEILGQVNLAQLRPTLIVYSHDLLGAGVRQSMIERLQADGYETLEHDTDTWAFCAGGLPPEQVAVLSSVWRWVSERDPAHPLAATRLLRAAVRRAAHVPERNGGDPAVAFPLTDQDQRYLKNGYDDRTPLPPDATAYLSNDNPRLLELRRDNAALDLPAVSHHMWTADRVAEHVNLRYFRGDNLYLWHYPEHPRAMALKLFIYMRHVEARGGGKLLELLSEDGSFGAWTTQVPGYGKISRDLLDSVNELLFLDRQLGVLSRERLRVLDIGAGYGRLAYRAAQALPGLADYCCVDAVPESSFLSEFYLRFRGCSPPARVLPLGDVPALVVGAFDLAVNVHSFSECTIAAIEWWVGQLQRLEVPSLFIVPNEADGILSREADGSFRSALPVLQDAGYEQVAKERAISDPAVREMALLNDNFYLFALRK